MKKIGNSSVPPVYCPAPSREALQAKFPVHSSAFSGGAPSVYRQQNPMVRQPQPLQRKQAAIRIPHSQGCGFHSCSVVQGAMTADELRANRSVQALKPQVDTLEGHITRHTLAAQTLATLRTLRNAVQETIRLRTRLDSLGNHPGHAARIVIEQGFETAVLAEIRNKEAAEQAAARARQNAALAAGPPLLPAAARWGPRPPVPPPAV